LYNSSIPQRSVPGNTSDRSTRFYCGKDFTYSLLSSDYKNSFSSGEGVPITEKITPS